MRWFREGAERGHPQAQYNLANMYRKGLGVKKDPEEAGKWLRKAAKAGHKGAKTALKSLVGDAAKAQK